MVLRGQFECFAEIKNFAKQKVIMATHFNKYHLLNLWQMKNCEKGYFRTHTLVPLSLSFQLFYIHYLYQFHEINCHCQ